MTHNLKVVWNAVPMFLELDGETGWRVRESWPKAGVWAALIVMREPGLQQPTQVVFRQWDETVEAFPAERTDDTFTEAVSFGAPIWGPQDSQSHVSNRLIELGREDAIAIMDKKTVVMVRGYCLSKLLLGPCGRWVIRDMDVQQLSCAEFYDDQHIKTLERRGDHSQEITGHDRLGVISHESGPALIATRLSPRVFRHVLSYHTGRYLDPELE